MNTKLKVNTNFFKDWSPVMAWVLGVIAGDGNISIKGKCITLTIGMSDKDVIEKIKLALKSKHKIYEAKRPGKKTQYVLSIGNQEIGNDLLKLGIIPRKSKVIRFPSVPEQYLSHFIRGYLDSNGSITLAGWPKWPKLTTSFSTSSELFGIQLRQKIYEKGFAANLYQQPHMSFEGKGYPGMSWRVVSQDKNFLPWLYQGKEIWYMERKFQRFQELLAKINNKESSI